MRKVPIPGCMAFALSITSVSAKAPGDFVELDVLNDFSCSFAGQADRGSSTGLEIIVH
jgi:hypothetical protein